MTKEYLDKQLEEYMGPDAIKAMLDQELNSYFGGGPGLEKKNAEAPMKDGVVAAASAAAANTAVTVST